MNQIKFTLLLVVLLPIFSQSDENMRANPEKYIGNNRITNVAKGNSFMVVTSDPLATEKRE